jgi:thioredoxin 1
MALQITDATLNDVLATDKLVVIDFGAEWCGPCKMLSPIIDELAEEFKHKAVIGKVDIDENDDMAVKYGIRNIPQVLFIKNGELIEKLVGAHPKSAYVEKIEKLG